MEKGVLTLLFLVDNDIASWKNMRKINTKTNKNSKEFSQLEGYKTSLQKLISFIYTNNNQLEHIMEKQSLFTIEEKAKEKRRNELNKYLENPYK